MKLTSLLQLPGYFASRLASSVSGLSRVPQEARFRGALDLRRDTSKHRIYSARYEDLLK